MEGGEGDEVPDLTGSGHRHLNREGPLLLFNHRQRGALEGNLHTPRRGRRGGEVAGGRRGMGGERALGGSELQVGESP